MSVKITSQKLMIINIAIIIYLIVTFVTAYGYTEKNQTLTLYSNQYTICSLDPSHHNSVECYLVDKGKNLRDYLEALSGIR